MGIQNGNLACQRIPMLQLPTPMPSNGPYREAQCTSCAIFQASFTWSRVPAHCHVAGNHASRLICIAVPGSACKQTYDTTHGGSGTEHPVASALGMPQPGIISSTEHTVASALGTPQPRIICLSLLPELQCSTPHLTCVRQLGVQNGIPAWPDPNAARPTLMILA